MLEIFVASDLHYGVSREGNLAVEALARKVCARGAEALLLGGDLAKNGETLEACLALFSGFRGAKMAIPGNHDIWVTDGRAKESWTLHEHVIPETFERHGFHPLHLRPLRLGDHAFVGSMGWYDYSFREDIGVELEHYVRKLYPDEPRVMWTDARFAKFELDDPALTRALDERLDAQLAEVADAKEVIALVHHLVTPDLLVTPRALVPRHWRFANTFLGSTCFGDTIERYANVTQVFCGHIHRSKTVRRGERLMTTIGGSYKEKELVRASTRSILDRVTLTG